MSDDRWIVIPNWERFQHYRDRDPNWIKDYREQLARDEYRGLSFHLRGILQGLRLAYAASNRQLRDNTLTLTRQLGQRVMRRDLEALNHAGLIEFSASRPLAPRYPSRASREDLLRKSKERASSGAIASAAAASPQEEDEPDFSLDRDASELAELERQLPDALQRQQPPADDVERDPQALERLRQLMSDLNYTNERSQM